MRFQQVVEELHVELIVFHDEDGFGHPDVPLRPEAVTPEMARPAARTTGPRTPMSREEP
jgi:hypothetical protein